MHEACQLNYIVEHTNAIQCTLLRIMNKRMEWSDLNRREGGVCVCVCGEEEPNIVWTSAEFPYREDEKDAKKTTTVNIIAHRI